jgi:hypothetical protein
MNVGREPVLLVGRGSRSGDEGDIYSLEIGA